MGRRVAYVALPTYDWSNLGEKSVVETLVACNLLPSQLLSYGRQADADSISAALEVLGFEVTCEACRIEKSSFKDKLRELSAACSEEPDVFVLVFSGHGRQELLTRHASLVFSDNKTLSSYSLDHLLASVAQRASVHTVLSCCTATGVPMAMPISAFLSSVSGQAAWDIAATYGVEQSMAGQRRVEVFSTSHVETQKAAVGGTLFVRALAKVLESGAPPLPALEERIVSEMAELGGTSDEVPTTVKVLRYAFVGLAFGPVCDEPKVRPPPIRMANRNIMYEPSDWYY